MLLCSATLRTTKGNTMAMPITDRTFAAYLKCETKAHLIATNAPVPHHEISEWRSRVAADYEAQCITRMSSAYDARLCYKGTLPNSVLQPDVQVHLWLHSWQRD